MIFQQSFEIKLAMNPSDLSSANLRVTLYNRALKPILMNYLARENLRVKNTTLADGFIDYEIACTLEQPIIELERVLHRASLVM